MRKAFRKTAMLAVVVMTMVVVLNVSFLHFRPKSGQSGHENISVVSQVCPIR